MPRNCRNLAAALICLWIGGFRLAADQGVPFTVAQWTSDSISPQNAVITAVITMTQTRDGYLWLGTPDGLVRFDGERFTTYNEGNTPGLKRGSVVKLFEDSRTNLWIGTDTGEVLVVNDGQVKPIQVGHGTREGRLAAIAEDASGAVWLYTADGYLGRYLDGKVDSWQVTANYPNARRLMVADSTGTLWIGTDFVLHRLRPALAGPSEVPTIAYSSAPVPELEFLLASGRGGYWRFAAGRIQKLNEDRLVDGVDWAYPWNPRLTPVRAACEDQEGNLVVGTGGQGVFLFDHNGGHIQLTETNGLSSTNILSLCLDHHGELWVGTDGRGLNRVRRKSFDVFEKSSGLTAQSVCDDGQGGLWVGYFGPHIDHLGTNGVETFGRTNQLVDLGVKSVLVDHDRNLWVGTRLGGLLTLQSGRFVKAPGSGPLEHDFEISALYEDREHGLWAGAQAGLAHWDGHVWALDTRIAPSVVVRAILEDTSSNLWVGTQGAGLVELRPGQAITYGKTNGLPSENISCLYQDSAGVIWAGTPVGLARLQGAQWISYAGHFSGASGNVGYLI